jgi:hypothetical protein
MSLETYKIIHLAGVMTLFLGLGGMVALQGHGSPPTKKLVTIFHGLGLLLILFGGFGMLAKLPYGMFPLFAMIKGVVWLALGGMLVLGKRRVFSAGVTWLIAIVLGVIAAWLGLMKPGATPEPVQSSALIETLRNHTS